MDETLPTLSPLEVRVLGVLVEKQLTVPDSYPLTLNSLVTGCNQKTSRDPIMQVSDTEVQITLDALRSRNLVIESSGASGRVMRYEHNLAKVLKLPSATVALLTALMLRGPQTPGELRSACDRMHRFADLSALDAWLEDMTTRSPGPLAMRLAKQPGAREHRYAHLLCGDVQTMPATDVAAGDGGKDAGITSEEIAALKANLAQVRAELERLGQLVDHLYEELGVARRN